MDILEQLWYGNLAPNEQFIQSGGEHHIARIEFEEEKEKLLAGLSPEIQGIFGKLFDRQIKPNAIAERDAFLYGFRLAVQLFTDGLSKSV